MNDRILIDSVVSTLRDVLGTERSAIALHEPLFQGNEWAYVKECLDSGWVSSVGKYVDRFEAKLAEYTGSPHAIAVVNGTAALHLSLLLAGVETGDEVLAPAMSFVATGNAVAYCGAIPHWVDSSPLTLGLDPEKLADYLEDIAEVSPTGCRNRRTGRRIKAVIAMHTFGHPIDLEPLLALCERFRLELIEDAAESLGSFYKGRHTGTWGRLAALSFNGNKVMTTGGGGAVLTHDPVLAKQAKHLSTTAKAPHRWAFNHDQVAFNYRMPNLNAALGCAQLEQLEGFIAWKRRLAGAYAQAFEGLEGVAFFEEPSFARSNYWLNAILLDPSLSGSRDPLLDATNEQGIMTRPVWTLMHRLPMYKDCPRMDLSVAENLESRLINLPSSAVLGRQDVEA